MKQKVCVVICTTACLLSLASPLSVSASEGADIPAQTITIPIKQWNELKSELQLQQAELTMLESDLMMLKQASAELMSSLSLAREQLRAAQLALTESKSELTSARSEIKKLSQSLMRLREQIDNERRKAKLAQRQHAFWGFVAGSLIIYIAK